MHPSNSFSRNLCSILIQPGTLVLGVGSPLRSDDGAGLMFCDILSAKGMECLKCEYGLENCMDLIELKKPKRLVIVDAALFNGGEPGDIVLARDHEVEERLLPVTTHSLPLKLVLKILRDSVGIEEVHIIGIYPKSLEIGEQVSIEVQHSLSILADVFKDCLEKKSHW